MPDSPLTADAFARSTDAVLASVSRVIDGKPAAVRAALLRLVQDKLLRPIPCRGYIVAPLGWDAVAASLPAWGRAVTTLSVVAAVLFQVGLALLYRWHRDLALR